MRHFIIKAQALYRIVAMFFVTILLVTFGVGLTSQPAEAWTGGNVWVNFGDWNCHAGGKVTKIQWGVDSYSAGPPAGDIGDNVIYPRVRVGSGAYNTLSYKLTCTRWGWFNYFAVDGSRTLTPYTSGLSYTF